MTVISAYVGQFIGEKVQGKCPGGNVRIPSFYSILIHCTGQLWKFNLLEFSAYSFKTGKCLQWKNNSQYFGCVFVLYSNYIYIVPLAVHTNQKRFLFERPREKRAVLREWKEALGSPVNKEDRVRGWSRFKSVGPMIAMARVWAIEVLACYLGLKVQAFFAFW